MKRTRIKVCGMTRVDQVQRAVEMGVDAIGVIVHANSARKVDIDQAKKIRQAVPAFVQLVGVSVNADLDYINYLATEIGLDLLQLHGDEPIDYTLELNRPYIRAIRARHKQQVEETIEEFQTARAFLLDPYVEGLHGGTGHSLDARCWPESAEHHAVVLAGGLNPSNLSKRVTELSPYAVDLNSGVERAPGDKNTDLIADAIAAVRDVDLAREN